MILTEKTSDKSLKLGTGSPPSDLGHFKVEKLIEGCFLFQNKYFYKSCLKLLRERTGRRPREHKQRVYKRENAQFDNRHRPAGLHVKCRWFDWTIISFSGDWTAFVFDNGEKVGMDDYSQIIKSCSTVTKVVGRKANIEPLNYVEKEVIWINWFCSQEPKTFLKKEKKTKYTRDRVGQIRQV